MSGTNPRDSIDLDELERQLKEAGAIPENFNWDQQIQSETPQTDPKIELLENIQSLMLPIEADLDNINAQTQKLQQNFLSQLDNSERRLTNQLTAIGQDLAKVKQDLMTLESQIESLQQHQSKVSLIQSDKFSEPGKEASMTFTTYAWLLVFQLVITGFVVTEAVNPGTFGRLLQRLPFLTQKMFVND